MVYRKKVYRKEERKKDWRKSTWARVAEGGLRAASAVVPYGDTAYKVVGALSGFNTEQHRYQTGGTGIFNSPTNGVAPTQAISNTIVQGLGGQDRIGNSIKVTHLDFKIHYVPDNNGTTSGNHRIRLILFWDRETTGTTPSHTDVIETIKFGDTADTRLLANLNPSNYGRFQILKDEVFTITPMATGYGSNFKSYNHDSYKLDHHCTWDDQTPSNFLKGHIYFIIMACNTSLDTSGNVTFDVTPGNLPGFFWAATLSYVDN